MDQNTEDLSCSFCSKNKDEVTRLIAGPGVYICDECIDSCYNLIQEQTIKDKKDQYQDWNYTPKDLFSSLNEYVIGQSHAKKVPAAFSIRLSITFPSPSKAPPHINNIFEVSTSIVS